VLEKENTACCLWR